MLLITFFPFKRISFLPDTSALISISLRASKMILLFPFLESRGFESSKIGVKKEKQVFPSFKSNVRKKLIGIISAYQDHDTQHLLQFFFLPIQLHLFLCFV